METVDRSVMEDLAFIHCLCCFPLMGIMVAVKATILKAYSKPETLIHPFLRPTEEPGLLRNTKLLQIRGVEHQAVGPLGPLETRETTFISSHLQNDINKMCFERDVENCCIELCKKMLNEKNGCLQSYNSIIRGVGKWGHPDELRKRQN